jgi:hypothetical protein
MTVTELWHPLSSKIFKCPKKLTPISYGSGRLSLAERARKNCDSDASGKMPDTNGRHEVRKKPCRATDILVLEISRSYRFHHIRGYPNESYSNY